MTHPERDRIYFTQPRGRRSLFQADRPLEHADGPFLLASSGSLPLGLAVATPYWVILVGAYFRLATSERNARDRIAVDITAPGSGLYLMTPIAERDRP